ncbi:MAG: NADH-quinone oxidoreductase subunit M [Phycisphaerales bacterium]
MELLALILIPLAFGIATSLMPAKFSKTVALLGTLLSLAMTLFVASRFDPASATPFQMEASFAWLPSLGLNLSVGIDSISLLLLLLTALLGPICVVASYTAITDRIRTFYACLLILQAAMTGVFMARDLILFYICFEFTLVPMFVLISLYGSTNRKKAAIKFFLYTFTGSVIALAGLVYIAAQHAALPGRSWTFDIQALESTARLLPASTQAWLLLAMMAGFAVKVPLFPVHTWLPLAHTEAPTAGSVVLAGVLLKLGTYAIYRFVLPFVPLAVIEYSPLLAVLCIIGIIYGGLICWVQTDVKKLVAYSSVAHLGFCMLGMFALNHTGIAGSVLYMINHGLSTGALFLLIGMIYERYHTRSMKELGGLGGKMPIWSTFMVFFVMASVGLPGLNGFVSEFMCMMGTFQASSALGSSNLWGSLSEARPVGVTHGNLGPWFALIAGTGVIIAAMYLLYMTGKVVWGKLKEPNGHGGHGHDSHGSHTTHSVLPTDLSAREIGVLVPLAVLCFLLGVYPKPILSIIEKPIHRTVALIDAQREQIRSTPSKPIDTHATNDIVQDLNVRLASLERGVSDLRERGITDDHPQMKLLVSELDGLRRNLQVARPSEAEKETHK